MLGKGLRQHRGLLLLVLAAGGYLVATARLDTAPRPLVVEEMRVALPLFSQVLMAVGDRYLAANVSTFRAVIASTETMREENFTVQAKLQLDASWLNPAHEDAYYVAAAILPWNGQVEAAQTILLAATRARPYDWQPPFFYAFNLYHIKRDALAAGNALLNAAPAVTSEGDRNTMLGLGYAWIEKGYEPRSALRIMERSAELARGGALRRYLLTRAERLRQLIALQEATLRFETKRGRPPETLNELVTTGFVSEIPADPIGFGFELDSAGMPAFRGSPIAERK